MSPVENAAVRSSLGLLAKQAYEAQLIAAGAPAGTVVRVDVYVVDQNGERMSETTKLGRRLTIGGNRIKIDVFVTLPTTLPSYQVAAADLVLTAAANTVAAAGVSAPVFTTLFNSAGVAAAQVSSSPVETFLYTIAAPPPPPCWMACSQLMNGLSKKDTDMCFQYGTDSMGNTNVNDVSCYPYGYNGCDSGMTYCSQKVCASKDKKADKCLKKLVKKGKMSKCSKRKWGRKKCKKTCCEAGY